MCGATRPGTGPKIDSSGTAVRGSNWRIQRAKGRRIFSRRAQVSAVPRCALSRRAHSAISVHRQGPVMMPTFHKSREAD